VLDQLTVDSFSPHLNSDFRLLPAPEAKPVLLQLIEASDLPASSAQGRRQGFSLIFRGPAGLYLPQQIYTIEHDEMEAMDIFLVPIRPDEKGMRLQAIFN
jgi:hypothetical protein